MKRGDPTDPRNRVLLKELLGQVMIRNTRALSGINIPPRFVQTIRIEPTKAETALATDRSYPQNRPEKRSTDLQFLRSGFPGGLYLGYPGSRNQYV